MKAGGLTRLTSLGASRFRVSHRLLIPARRRHHAPSRPPRQALTLRPDYSGTSLKPVIPMRQRGRRFVETPYNNSLTSDFSSFNLCDRLVDLFAAEFVDRKPLHDFPFSAAHPNWE